MILTRLRTLGTAIARPGVLVAALAIAAPVLAGAGVRLLAGDGWTLVFGGAVCLIYAIAIATVTNRG